MSYRRTAPRLTGIAVGAFPVINSLNLTPDRDWGGDFARHLVHARNILAGKPFDSGLEPMSTERVAIDRRRTHGR